MTFPVFSCKNCDDLRMTFADLSLEGTLIRKCLECDSDADPETIQWLTAQEAMNAGYVIEGEEPKDTKKGCRDGACGIQQPEK